MAISGGKYIGEFEAGEYHGYGTLVEPVSEEGELNRKIITLPGPRTSIVAFSTGVVWPRITPRPRAFAPPLQAVAPIQDGFAMESSSTACTRALRDQIIRAISRWLSPALPNSGGSSAVLSPASFVGRIVPNCLTLRPLFASHLSPLLCTAHRMAISTGKGCTRMFPECGTKVIGSMG